MQNCRRQTTETILLVEEHGNPLNCKRKKKEKKKKDATLASTQEN